MNSSNLYGLMAEFKGPEEVLFAANEIHSAGFRAVDAYSPFPIDGLAEKLGQHSNLIGKITFISGVVGVITAYALQYYSAAMAYPMNVGGRPLNSWPSFMPICFELMVLFAVLGGVFTMFYLNRLPQPYHPVFNAPEFSLATRNRFFILIEKRDPLFDSQSTKTFLESLHAESVVEVEL